MIRPDDIETDVTLELDGTEITPDKFRKGVNAFVGLLESITQAVCRDQPLVEWRMQVKGGSNLVGAAAADGADATHVRRILQLVAEGLDQFEIEGEVPPVYPDKAVRHVRDLSNISARKVEDDTVVGIWVKRQRREITPAISATARAVLKSGFQEYGTVEGELSVLSARGNLHFVIYERVWDRPVRCTVPERLVQTVMDSWRSRVAIHGMVRYRPDGLPTSIEVDEIEAFPHDKDLPGHEQVRGILREGA